MPRPDRARISGPKGPEILVIYKFDFLQGKIVDVIVMCILIFLITLLAFKSKYLRIIHN